MRRYDGEKTIVKITACTIMLPDYPDELNYEN